MYVYKGRENIIMKTVPNAYHTHISSKHSLFRLNLKEVWTYRDLIWLFTKRSFVVSFKQTILGPLWIFLTPLISALIYAFVFGGIAKIPTDGVPTVLFYLTSNAVWIYFSSCVTNNASTFTANAHVFGKVYFPRLTVPISNVLSSVIRFGVQFVLVLGFLSYYLITQQIQPNWLFWLLLPLVLLHLGVLGLGVGIIVSSLTTKYRDLSVLVTFGVSLWMYVTPIVYPLENAPEMVQTILMINPVTQPVELFRYAVLGKGTVLVVPYLILIAVTLVVLLLGIIIFNKVERNFMDTV